MKRLYFGVFGVGLAIDIGIDISIAMSVAGAIASDPWIEIHGYRIGRASGSFGVWGIGICYCHNIKQSGGDYESHHTQSSSENHSKRIDTHL